MRRLAASLALGAVLAAAPAMAVPTRVGTVRYEDPRRVLTIDTQGAPQVYSKRLINPDRLVIDLYDAQLAPGMPPPAQPLSARVRSLTVSQFSLSPAIVRVILELAPGFDPMVVTRQEAGRVALTLGDAPRSIGERDLETLPPLSGLTRAPDAARATPAPGPDIVSLPAIPVSPAPLSRDAQPGWTAPLPASPSPAASRRPSARATPPPSPPPAQEAEPEPDAPLVRRDFGSTLAVRWQQLEAVDYYGPEEPIFGYPAGISGLEWRHWFMRYLGAGLDSHYASYDLMAEGVREHRTDWMVLPEVVARYPLLGGWLEPELNAGVLIRGISASPASSGTTYPFAPTQSQYGLVVGAGVRMRLVPYVSLDLTYQIVPSLAWSIPASYLGDDGAPSLSGSRFNGGFTVDFGPMFYRIGYTDDTLRRRAVTPSAGQTFTAVSQLLAGVQLSAGLRY